MSALTQDRLQNYISLYGARTVEAIQKLPKEDLDWVVYNSNLVNAATQLIIGLRGVAFFDDYIRVVPMGQNDNSGRKHFYDLNLFDLIGNGHG